MNRTMANSVVDVAKEAFANANYHLAMNLYEQILRLDTTSAKLMDIYFGYADSLARTGNIKESFDVYAFICSRLSHAVPLDRLKHLTIGLLDSVTAQQFGTTTQHNGNAKHLNGDSIHSDMVTRTTTAAVVMARATSPSADSAIEATTVDGAIVDPLMCPVCDDILMWPVTTVCGHTFCRHCSYGQTLCRICGKKVLMYGDSFKQDVLVSRLVDKWWSADIQAQLLNVESKAYLKQNMLDDALKSCNASLEKSELILVYFLSYQVCQ